VIASRPVEPRFIDLVGFARLVPIVLLALAISAIAVVPDLEISAAAVGVIFVVIGTLIRPEFGVMVLLTLVPFSGIFKLSLGDFDLSPTEPLFAVFLVSWGLRSALSHGVRLPSGRYIAPVAALLLLVMASALTSTKLTLTLKEAIKWLEILLVASFVSVYFRQVKTILVLLGVLFVAASAEAMYGMYQFVTGTGPAYFAIGPFIRAFGHFGQPNPFAGYLASVLPLALVMIFVGPSRRYRAFAFVCAGIIGTAILMSLSRGAWLGLVVALMVMLLSWRPSAARVLALFAAVGVVLAILGATNLMPPILAERLGPVAEYFGVFDVRDVRPTPENFALIERLAHWQAGWEMFLDNPILGVGAGNYPVRYIDYSLPGWPDSLGHAHNFYLNMAAEAGLAASLALVWVLVSIMATARAAFRKSVGFSRGLALGLLGATVVFAVHSFFDNLLVNSMAIQIGVFLGLAMMLLDTTSTETLVG
jgi:O-antigen ligase